MKNKTKNHIAVFKKFGNFKSVTKFLDSYRTDEKKALIESIAIIDDLATSDTMSVAARHLHGKLDKRPIVEVEATIIELKEKAPTSKTTGHYLMLIEITRVLSKDSRVSIDVDDAFEHRRLILVATRYGDSMGIMEPINELAKGIALKIQGEWITADQSFSHGGEQMSVLHFTHHPLGFICTPVKCYT